jgi:hypothetical protein
MAGRWDRTDEQWGLVETALRPAYWWARVPRKRALRDRAQMYFFSRGIDSHGDRFTFGWRTAFKTAFDRSGGD